MLLTDPTYLRYIVDGTESQSSQQENIASLPQGVMGMYEESIPAEQNISQRKNFLQFFSVWALLKKEVSASFVAELLNWKEQEVIDQVSVYSKWFNSPASGTYILYHERLRTFLLEKITSEQLTQTNQRQICWKELAIKYNSIYGNHLAFKGVNEFSSSEAQTFYLKGWAESIIVDDITDELVYKAIQALKDDSTSMEYFLQVYAQHELFFGSPSQEKIDRLNKTLNLQWALDIIAQFPQE